MKPSFSLNQAPFYYPGQEIRVRGSSSYIMSGEDFKNLERGRVRLLFIAVLFAFFFFAIAARLFEYTVLSEKSSATVAVKSTTVLDLKPTRADITDRNGVVLATSLHTADLLSDNSLVDDVEQIATDLVEVLPSLDYDTLKNKLSKKSKRTNKGVTVTIMRDLTPKEQQRVHALGHPALQFTDGEKRVYPQGNLFSHIIGEVGVDEKGLSGLEKSFDDVIRNDKEPLRLSIDAGVQYAVREIFAEDIQKYKAKNGAVIVMNVNTGEIISMVSLPDFDPNNPPAPNDDRRFNRASLGVYEFGSVFKIFNAAMALDGGVVTPYEKIDSSEFKFGGKVYRDDHPQNGPLNLYEILAHSSNLSSARIALRAGSEKQKEFFERIGFMEPLRLELPEKGTPILPKRWSDTNLISKSFGYGISVTPVHIITAVSAIVNGGILRPATIIATDKPAEGVRILSEENSKKIREMLRYVVLSGTGKGADVAGYEVGGKTGTAEKVVGGKYDKKTVRATFVSIFPSSNPKYAMLVMLDEPKAEAGIRGRTAGANAAPITKRILEKIAPQLNVVPDFAINSAREAVLSVALNF